MTARDYVLATGLTGPVTKLPWRTCATPVGEIHGLSTLRGRLVAIVDDLAIMAVFDGRLVLVHASNFISDAQAERLLDVTRVPIRHVAHPARHAAPSADDDLFARYQL